jgi:hypothetical protein
VNGVIWQQRDGMRTISPLSGIQAGIFQQEIENEYYHDMIKTDI